MPTRTPYRNRIGVRLAVVLVLLVLAGGAAMVTLLLRSQRDHLVNQTVSGADILSDTIRRSTYHAMLEDRRSDVYRVMDTIARQQGIERVRIFNKEGRITFSTDSRETGHQVDLSSESCFACHAANQPIVRLNLPSRSRIYEHAGHRVLGMVTPIYNEPACWNGGCHVHSSTKTVLGVVDIVTSLEPIDADLATLQQRTVGIAMAMMLGLVIVVIVFTGRYVVNPVARLVDRTRRIAQGDLSVGKQTPDATELGVLEASFNDMAGALARMRAERLELLGSLERQVEERTAQLKRAQERLVQSEKLSSLGRLAASIAHEINNPLAGILTYAKLLIRTLNEGPPDERTLALVLKHLALVQKETERCTVIVRNLLDFARERALTLSSVSVNGVLDDALMLVMNQARLQNIVLEKRFGDVPMVHADAGQLRQAFVNVIINACDAMPKGGSLTVETRSVAGGDAVEVCVRDTGIGIPKAVLTKVLDPFFTTKERGTGLGLSVVYGIVERHGGKLAIESEEGHGTEVRFTLMLAPADETGASVAGGSPAATGVRS